MYDDDFEKRLTVESSGGDGNMLTVDFYAGRITMRRYDAVRSYTTSCPGTKADFFRFIPEQHEQWRDIMIDIMGGK